MTFKTRSITRQLSPTLVILGAALFATGVIGGWLSYLDRSPVREKFIPGTSAWWPHVALAAGACAVFGYARWRRQRGPGGHSGRLWSLAPLGKAAARRVSGTALGALRRPAGAGRVLAALPPAGLFLYGFFRAGLQVTGGLNPNFTVNAWGGPTYLGAMACHYLDGFLLMAVAAWLLDRILLPDPLPRVGARFQRNQPAAHTEDLEGFGVTGDADPSGSWAASIQPCPMVSNGRPYRLGPKTTGPPADRFGRA